MKMVILGAQAPKCESKPSNPTSTTAYGTMIGQATSQNKLNRDISFTKKDKVHKHQYQGLLNPPTKVLNELILSGKNNVDPPAATNTAVGFFSKIGEKGEGELSFLNSTKFDDQNAKIQAYSFNGSGSNENNASLIKQQDFSLVQVAAHHQIKPTQESQQLQAWNTNQPELHAMKLHNKAKSIGQMGVGLPPTSKKRPPEKKKTLKQIKEEMNIKFYQTVSNQPQSKATTANSQSKTNIKIAPTATAGLGVHAGRAINFANQGNLGPASQSQTLSFNAITNVQSHVKFEEPLSVKNSKMYQSKDDERNRVMPDKSYSFSNLNKMSFSNQREKLDDKQILLVQAEGENLTKSPSGVPYNQMRVQSSKVPASPENINNQTDVVSESQNTKTLKNSSLHDLNIKYARSGLPYARTSTEYIHSINRAGSPKSVLKQGQQSQHSSNAHYQTQARDQQDISNGESHALRDPNSTMTEATKKLNNVYQLAKTPQMLDNTVAIDQNNSSHLNKYDPGMTQYLQSNIPNADDKQTFGTFRKIGSDMGVSKYNSSVDTRAKSPKGTVATMPDITSPQNQELSPQMIVNGDSKQYFGQPHIIPNQGIYIQRKNHQKMKTSLNEEFLRLEHYSSEAQDQLLKSYQQGEAIDGQDGKGAFLKKRNNTSHGTRQRQIMRPQMVSNLKSQSNIFGPFSNQNTASRGPKLPAVLSPVSHYVTKKSEGSQQLKLQTIQEKRQKSYSFLVAANLETKACQLNMNHKTVQLQKREQIRTAYTRKGKKRQISKVVLLSRPDSAEISKDLQMLQIKDIPAAAEITDGKVPDPVIPSTKLNLTAEHSSELISPVLREKTMIAMAQNQKDHLLEVAAAESSKKQRVKSSDVKQRSNPAPCDRFMKRSNYPKQIQMVHKPLSSKGLSDKNLVKEIPSDQLQLVATKRPPAVADESMALAQPAEGLTNLRDTLTPTDFIQKKGGTQLTQSKSRESKAESRVARQSMHHSRQIDLDNFNDEISGLRLGTLFKPYKQGRSNTQSQNLMRKSSKAMKYERDSKDTTVMTNQRKTVLKSEDYKKDGIQKIQQIQIMTQEQKDQVLTQEQLKEAMETGGRKEKQGKQEQPDQSKLNDSKDGDDETANIIVPTSHRDSVSATIKKLHQKREEILERQKRNSDADQQSEMDPLMISEGPDSEDEGEGEDEESEDEEEPLILQLLESMFSRKKTVQESLEMQQDIDVEAIRQEFRSLSMAEKVRIADLKRSQKFEQRMRDCEHLNKLIQADNEEYSGSVFDKPHITTRQNPFYAALRAQQIERAQYMKLLKMTIQHQIMSESGEPIKMVENKDIEAQEQDVTMAKIENDARTKEEEQPHEIVGSDIFQHTYVNV